MRSTAPRCVTATPISRRASAASALAVAALLLAPPLARGEEIVVQNDSVEEGSSGTIQAGFIANESAAAWLTSPCDGRIVAVQIFWRSLFGDAEPSLEDSITIAADGAFPEPGATLALLEAPVMTDGVLNEFRYLDEFNTVPIEVPISAGERFVVSFTFANTPDPFLGPSLVTDVDGCQNGKNGIFAIPGGWRDSCLIGLSGDFFIRAVIDCESTPGACCLPDGTCRDSLDEETCANAGGSYQGSGSVCGASPCVQACCFETGGCLDLPADDCANAGGFAQGLDTECATTECFPIGACCLPTGDCADDQSPDDCEAMGGVFQGSGSTCGGTECQQPVGACCFDTGFCLILIEDECDLAGATWAGMGTDCEDHDESGRADDCEALDCPADLDGSGAVDFGDILDVLQVWGPCSGCPEDLNGDEVVDFADVLFVLARWGPCA